MAVNVQQVEMLNQKAQRLNSERQKLIGMKESARQSYDKAVFAYQQKYGVHLDDTNLQQEYNAVNTQLQQDYEVLNKLVLSIESGEYKNQAQQSAMQSTPVAQTNTFQPNASYAPPTQSNVQAQTQPATQAFGQQAQSPTASPSYNAFGTQASGVATESSNEPIPPKATLSPEALAQVITQTQSQKPAEIPNFENPFGSQTPQQNQSQSGTSTTQQASKQDDVSEQSFTPQGWGMPNKDLNANFNNILGGNS